MKTFKKTAYYLAVCFFSLLNLPVYAANIEAGGERAIQCAGCHGAKGIANSGQYPNLAGQQTSYLKMQLTAFKEETRSNPIMRGMATNLTTDDINNLAAFFSSLPNEKVDTKVRVPTDAKAKFAACAGCHGSNAEGQGIFPRLANQNAEYLTTQLLAFKNGTRKGGPMPAVAKNLTEQDIKTLTAYLSSLKPAKE